jgi:hypothetical protein
MIFLQKKKREKKKSYPTFTLMHNAVLTTNGNGQVRAKLQDPPKIFAGLVIFCI